MNIKDINTDSQYVLIKSESATGIVLNIDNTYYLQKGNNYYQLFEDFIECRNYANHEIKKSNGKVEFNIYDCNYNSIEVLR